MADLSLDCATPDCGQALVRVPGRCPACGTFWGSRADLRPSERAVGSGPRGEMPVSGGAEPYLDCGHPGSPDRPCEFCGRVSTARPSGKRVTCLEVGGSRLVLPHGTEIVLGRRSAWNQVAGLFMDLTDEVAAGVSRSHAAVVVGDDHVRVTDLRSLNGTWIDGVELAGTTTERPLPTTLVLGVPGAGLAVTIRVLATDETATGWNGARDE